MLRRSGGSNGCSHEPFRTTPKTPALRTVSDGSPSQPAAQKHAVHPRPRFFFASRFACYRGRDRTLPKLTEGGDVHFGLLNIEGINGRAIALATTRAPQGCGWIVLIRIVEIAELKG